MPSFVVFLRFFFYSGSNWGDHIIGVLFIWCYWSINIALPQYAVLCNYCSLIFCIGLWVFVNVRRLKDIRGGAMIVAWLVVVGMRLVGRLILFWHFKVSGSRAPIHRKASAYEFILRVILFRVFEYRKPYSQIAYLTAKLRHFLLCFWDECLMMYWAAQFYAVWAFKFNNVD